jgi:hypothetical protein
MPNWYAYIGVGDPTLSTSYRIVSVKVACTPSGVVICAIYLPGNDVYPDGFDQRTLLYIANTLATQIAQPTGPGVMRFVYLKGPTS